MTDDLSRFIAPGTEALLDIASEIFIERAAGGETDGDLYAEVIISTAERHGFDMDDRLRLHAVTMVTLNVLHTVLNGLAQHQAAVEVATAERAGAAVQ